MATANTIMGDSGANSLQGTDAADLIYGFDPEAIPADALSITATRVASGFDSPVFATAPPTDASRLFIVEKGGRIDVLDRTTGEVQATPLIDLSDEIATSGEQGLLGLAFDPDFGTNGFFYVNLTNRSGDTEIRRYQISPTNPDQADPATGRLVTKIDQPDSFTNHNGGWIGFGPEGHLYAALGDGGGSGDPLDNAQDVDSLLGKILRIDVATDAFPADAARNYGIPADNPFVGQDGADEIWALGLRNPWRAGFDRGSGELFIADVGQGAWEEIDLGAAGANYGWNLYEGPDEFSSGALGAGDLTFPIHAYGHDAGRSITGGYVYRGPGEAMHGQYVFADFATGRVWTLQRAAEGWEAAERTASIQPDAGAIDSPVSFGEDAEGNLYLVDFDGDLFRLTPEGSGADGADRIDGGGGGDVMFGGGGDDTLLGGAGADRLDGGLGNDRLDGQGGGDVLRGGAGDDAFVFAPQSGHAVVLDFSAGAGSEDSLEFAGGAFADVPAVLAASRQVGPDTVITYDDANTITLENVPTTALHADDFGFL